MSANQKEARRFWRDANQAFREQILMMCEVSEEGGFKKFVRFDWAELPARVKNQLVPCMIKFDLIK